MWVGPTWISEANNNMLWGTVWECGQTARSRAMLRSFVASKAPRTLGTAMQSIDLNAWGGVDLAGFATSGNDSWLQVRTCFASRAY